MTSDWPVWALASFASGAAYALVCAALNKHRGYGPNRKWLLFAELVVGLGLIAGAVIGMSGLWWLWSPIALAYISLGGPIAVVLLITGAVSGASEDEYAEIQRIKGRASGAVRVPGDYGRHPEAEDIAN